MLKSRKSIRLKDYDYSQNGYYFVTVCTQDRKKILCDIVGNDALVVPSEIGTMLKECLYKFEKLNENIKIDSFCLMPNHIHFILIIHNQCEERRGSRSLQEIMKDFKSITTRFYNKSVPEASKNTLWQKSFYEHIIRNETDLNEIRVYIQNNPIKWKLDKYYN